MKRQVFIVLLVTLLFALTSLVAVACDGTVVGGFTVTFVADGVTVKSVKCDNGATAVEEPNVPDKYGYVGAWENYTLNGQDLTVNAIYTAKQYTVIFNYNGSENSYQTHTTVTFDKSVGVLPEPTKTDNYFAGWFYGDMPVLSESVWHIDSSEQIVLTAKWLPSSQAITYTYNKSAMTCTVKSVYAAMTSVVVPSTYNGYTVTAIADGAFANCNSLSSVTIPATVTSIGERIFAGSNKIESITVDRSNAYFYSESNCIVAKSSKTVVAGAISSVIPNGVESIGSGAFRGVGIRSINLPSSVAYVGNGAFSYSSLTSITIPASVKSLGKQAFYYCESLQSVTFSDSSALTTIPSQAFEYCKKLQHISIPDSVVNIDSNAFNGCYALTTVTFGANSNLRTVGASAFAYCYDLANIDLPGKLETIGASAFYDCIDLKSITIPASVTVLGYDTFAFSGLEDVYYGGTMANWCAMEFEYDSYNPMRYADNFYIKNGSGEWEIISKIELPSTLTEVGKYQFYNFGNMQLLTIPASVTKIGNYAFSGCSFTNVYYDGTWEDWLQIEYGYGTQLQNCADNIYFKDGNGNWTQKTELIITDGTTEIKDYEFSNYKSVTSVVIPDTVTNIGAYAFSGCTSITSITLPSSVTVVGEGAFSGCTSLETVVINEGITALPYNLFYGCSSLTSVTLPSSITVVSYSIFYGCDNLAIYYCGTLEQWCGISFGTSSYYRANANKSLYLKDAGGEWKLVTELVIPQQVSQIGNSQFSGFSSIISVTIHGGVVSIGDNAFSNCTSLTAITVSDSVTTIGREAFSGCKQLEHVTFDAGSLLTTIHDGAFLGCVALQGITVPASVTTIGDWVFEGCVGLEYIAVAMGNETYHSYGDCLIETATGTVILGCKNSVLPTDGSIVKIASNAFYYCEQLTSIVIPEGVTYIGENAFAYSGLQQVSLPSTLKGLTYNSFFGCEELTAVTFVKGSKLSWVTESVFGGCPKLDKIYYGGTLADWCNIDFDWSETNPMAFANHFYMLNGSDEWELVTEIVLDGDIAELKSYVFDGLTELTKVTISTDVTSLGNNVFNDCSNLTTIYYLGTVEQWEQISKSWDWNDGSVIEKIVCSNGTVTLRA